MTTGFPGSAIVGNGIDLVSVKRIQKTLARHPERFARKILSPDAVSYTHLTLPTKA